MSSQVLVIDNYDSFTYNLVQELGELGATLCVVRNDAKSLDEIVKMKRDGIVLSPGPGRPAQAGVTEAVIDALGATVPMLGVCLGHQAIAEVYGARIVHAPTLMHGKTSLIYHDGEGVFAGLPDPFVATRYHSLIVTEASIPPLLHVSARSQDGLVMGLRHRELPVEGVQFHPESILTEVGPQLLSNFLRRLA